MIKTEKLKQRRHATSLILLVLTLTGVFSPAGLHAQSAADYAAEPMVQTASFSPDGEILALSVAQVDNQQIKLITLKGIKPVAVKTIDIDVARNSREDIEWLGWAGDDHLISYVRFIDRGHKGRPITANRLIRLSRDGSELKDLGRFIGLNLRGNRDRTNGTGLISLMPQDPDNILMSVGWSGASTVNVNTGHATLIRRGTKKTQSFTPDLRGEIRITQGREVQPYRYYFTIRDKDSDTWRDYSDYNGLKADERVVGFMEDPNELVIARYGTSGTLEFQVYNLEQQKVTRTLFSDPTYDADTLVYDSQLRKVIGVEYIADSPKISFFDKEYEARIQNVAKHYPGYTLNLMAESADGQKMILRASSASNPGVIILHDVNLDTRKVLASDYPALDKIKHGSVLSITYPATDGTDIPAYVTLPSKANAADEAQNLPFIILPHGGPYSRDYADFDWLAQFLASKGYGVLQMNFRGSEGYGEAFVKAGRDDWAIMRSDVNDGARWLQETKLADANRMCIMGWSFGGYMAQMAASEATSIYKCAASVNGISDWTQMQDFDDKEFWGELNKNFKLKRAASPIFSIKGVSIPIYLAHAKLDTVVPYTQFKRYEKSLKKNGKTYEAHSFDREDHEIHGADSRTLLLETMSLFFETHIGPSEWAND